MRAKAVLAQAASEEVGLHLQRTSPTMGGIFVRGLTGTKVNVYVDGVRYTTSAQRGGVSTFFNMVEPETLEGIEVVRGPSSAEYGSDALGGTVQLLTRAAVFSAGGERVSGSWSASGGSADASFGSSLVTRYAAPTFGLLGTVAGRRVNTLRAADGDDSRNAVTRFLGLPASTVIDERAARHRLHPVRRPAQGQLGDHAHRPARRGLPARPAGRRQALRPAAGRRRQPGRRPAQPDGRPPLRALREVALGPRRPPHALVLVLGAARGARQPGRQRQPARERQPRAGAHRRARPAGRGAPQPRPPRPDARGRRLLREDGGTFLRDEPDDRRHDRPAGTRAGRPALPPWRRLPAGRLRGGAGPAAAERRAALFRGLLRGGRGRACPRTACPSGRPTRTTRAPPPSASARSGP